MALTASIELAESWQNIITADGNEEFTLVHYAPWADCYGPRGSGYRFAEMGDALVTADGTVTERLRLSRIIISPSMGDKEGCRYEQVYSSSNHGLKGKEQSLRTSWNESFSSGLEVLETTRVVGSTVGDYETGAKRTVKDADSNEVIPKLVYVPSIPTYRVTYYVDTLRVGTYVNALGTVNSDLFFVPNRRIDTGDQAIRDAEGNVVFVENGNNGDKHKWLFSDFSANRVGINNYEVNVEFMYYVAGWNGTLDVNGNPTGEIYYLNTVFSELFSFVKELRRPDPTPPGRT